MPNPAKIEGRVSLFKVEKILKGSLDSIPSPLPSVKIQIKGWKVCMRCKGKKLLGVVNKLLKTKSLLTSPSNVLPYHLKSTSNLGDLQLIQTRQAFKRCLYDRTLVPSASKYVSILWH
jgi:hypothetical protein